MIKEARYYYKLDGLSRAMKKFLLSQTPLKKLINTPIYNKFYYKRIKTLASKMHPFILQIENTNLCNARCIMCPHVIMKSKGKIMSFENFKTILDNVMKDYKIKRLIITGFGEPFVDKNLLEKIRYSNERYPNLKIDLYTNASILNEKTIDEILKTKIARITFSINGTEKNYKKIMGLSYENTKKNVLYFLNEKKKLKNSLLTNVSLMILKENEEDVKRFMEFWGPLSDSVRVYAPSNWAGQLGSIEKRADFGGKRWPCSALWFNITVDVDGNLVMCCRDYESKIKFGNLIKEDVKKIRESEKYKKLQEMQLNIRNIYKNPIFVF